MLKMVPESPPGQIKYTTNEGCLEDYLAVNSVSLRGNFATVRLVSETIAIVNHLARWCYRCVRREFYSPRLLQLFTQVEIPHQTMQVIWMQAEHFRSFRVTAVGLFHGVKDDLLFRAGDVVVIARGSRGRRRADLQDCFR